jgi:5-methylthioadenosine/S-adenosylhomocysteine deaminase
MAPVGEAYEALVSLAQPSNVDTVIVDGRILRQSGKFTALDQGKVVQETALSLSNRRLYVAQRIRGGLSG